MLDFPASPTLNQIFTAPNGSTWIWDGAKWASTSAGTGFLPLAGGTMVGDIVLAHDPPAALNPATKQYVDATNIRYKNRIINGDASIDQRTAFAGVQVTSSTSYVADRWKMIVSVAAQKGVSGAVATTAPGMAGFTNYFYWNTSVAAYAVTTTDFFMLQQFVEGVNFNDAGWGAAGALPVVLEFWAMSTLTGTFGGSLRNAANNRSYVFSYVILTANVWQKFRISIPGDTAGTWAVAANALALNLTFSIGAGASLSGSPGSWQAANLVSATGAVSVVGTLNAIFNITGVALMVGAAAANAEPEFKKYSDNLIDCRRYYYKPPGYTLTASYSNAAGVSFFTTRPFMVSMRAAPTQSGGTIYGGVNAGSPTLGAITTDAGIWTATATAAGIIQFGVQSDTYDADF
jgi:hypothetical protein